ncbi:MAG TPA: glycosyltransferase family 1 protein, partial [Aggregatilineales bacterium]|nr:glycosyltransferase family 1 protein [Aggregatilineales bacterium]
IGRLVRELVAELAREDPQTRYKLFVAGAKSDSLPPVPGSNFQWYPTRVTPLWFSRLWYRAQVYLPVEFFIGRVKLFHAPDFTLPPTLPGTKTLLTVHDLSYVRAPETATPFLRRYLDRVVPRSVRRADHVLADSQATKDDLVSLYETTPEKVTVLLSGVESRFKRIDSPGILRQMREKYHIPDHPYIFSIGTVQPRKNYTRLIEALHLLGDDLSHVNLVIAGGKGWLDAPIYQSVKNLNMSERVHFIGFVDDEDVPALYSGAILTGYPSLYEGFGFPIVESMACGTPVLTSTVSSMPEVAGNAAIMVDPYDVNAIAQGLRRLLTEQSLRETLITDGYQQAAQFTWKKAARQLKTIYADMLNG